MIFALACIAAAAWVYLFFCRSRFWRADQRLAAAPPPAQWPSVVAVIPARDEAANIGEVITAHAETGYGGDYSVILVDDGSSDGTAAQARAAAGRSARDSFVTVIDGAPLPAGWSGKMWAVRQGLAAAFARNPDYILLTDADIVLRDDTLARLVALAEARRLALVSLMARLDARGIWGGLLVPAFIYFFQKLYPFPAVNDPERHDAAAAGGCMLVRADALRRIGGVDAIRADLIDDCALARRIKDLPPANALWLGLADDEAVSLRDNRSLASIWSMVARTAYAQLQFSPVYLAGAVFGMALVYLAPSLIALSFALHGNGPATVLALATWALMAATYWPTLKLYGQQPWQAATLPAAAALYCAMTVSSAVRSWRGRGGQWKGRVYGAER